MKKYYIWIIFIISIVLLIVGFIILINIPHKSMFQGVNIVDKYNLEKGDLDLLKIDSSNQIEPIKLIKSDGRKNIKLFKFKNYFIYLSELKGKSDFNYNSVFLINQNYISKTNFNRYYNYKLDNGELSIGIEKIRDLSSIYILGNMKNFNKKIINKNLYSWYGTTDNLGLMYNSKDSFVDLYFHDNSSLPVNIIIYKKKSHIYLMFITSTSDKKIDNTSIEQDILSKKIFQD